MVMFLVVVLLRWFIVKTIRENKGHNETNIIWLVFVSVF